MTGIPALRLEVKKDKWEQLQNGTYKLQVTVNPDDLRDNADEVLLQFIKAGMGERFMMGVAKIGPDEQPVQPVVAPEPPRERKHWDEMRPSQQAGIRCSDFSFRHWAQRESGAVIPYDEMMAIAWLYRELNIKSRKELDSDPAKKAAWDALDARFLEETRMAEKH